jgi:group I intron endonuclease
MILLSTPEISTIFLKRCAIKIKIGVYLIRNIVTGGVYVGSTSYDFENRFRTHRKHLRDNKHDNAYLQHVYNKYGLENFEFIILEEVIGERNAVVAAEQRWIDFYLGQKEVDCYNLSSTASSNKGSKRSLGFVLKNIARLSKTHPGLIAPDGTIYSEIVNLLEFCRQHNLNHGNIRAVLSGKRSHCSGWRAIDHSMKLIRVPWRKWQFVAPDGTLHEFKNLNEFCREHGLHHSAMVHVRDGKRPHHKGWRAYREGAQAEDDGGEAAQLRMNLE